MISNTNLNQNRIQYIDAMRGFTILLVIYHHVLLKCVSSDSFSFNDIFIVFRMPLFFFVSGFVLYKSSKIWNLTFSLQFLKKKFAIQVVSTLFFLFLADTIFKNNYVDSLFSFAKNGYWFTLTLFEYFILFTLIELLIYKLKLRNIETLILILYALVIIITPFLSYVRPELNLNENPLYNLFGIKQFYYFIYFIFGALVKKHFQYFERYILIDKAFAVILITFVFCFIYSYSHDNIIVNIIARLSEAFLGILIVFSVFRNYSFFSDTTVIGKSLQYIGKRTLDIYLLHYFFLPQYGLINFSLIHLDDPILELLVVMFFSIVTLFLCLLISNVIRVSPSLAHLLFGVKKMK